MAFSKKILRASSIFLVMCLTTFSGEGIAVEEDLGVNTVCKADFTADKTAICTGQSVTFYNNSQGIISYYLWSFEGGTPNQATGAGPHTVTYNSAGTFSVTLSIRCRDGDDSNTKKNFITVYDCANSDFGDAPDPSYPTLLSSNGAWHKIKDGYHLGNTVDAESNGKPSPAADGDDNLNTDDEDGITFLLNLITGLPTMIKVTASGQGWLNGWLDFDGNGDWNGPEEHLPPLYISSSPELCIFKVPITAKVGTTFARFRFSSQKDLDYKGQAIDGEVEDYQVQIHPIIIQPFTKIIKHRLCLSMEMDIKNIGHIQTQLSGSIQQEVYFEGISDGIALDDDSNGMDEVITKVTDLSLVGFDPLVGTIKVTHHPTIPSYGLFQEKANATPGKLDVKPYTAIGEVDSYIDAFFTIELVNLGKVFQTTLPKRLQGILDQLPPLGSAIYTEATNVGIPIFTATGEAGTLISVKTCETAIYYDYGDAPSPYPVKLSATDDGGRHPIKMGVHLGNAVDSEVDGQPHAKAEGDDNNNVDDEDGLVAISPLIPNNFCLVKISASTKGYLNGWIDFYQDGDWVDANERIFNEVALSAGINPLTFTVPATALPGKTFLRLRFSSKKLVFDPQKNSYTAEDGEVEDYQVIIRDPKTAILGDWVWMDKNKNGIQEDGESGWSGVNVYLYHASGTLIASTVTAFDGHYYFNNIAAGDYYIKFELSPGYSFSPKDQGSDDSRDSDADPTTGKTDIFSLAAGSTDLSRDAGIYRSGQEGYYDFGDAPAPPYPTLMVNNGARHYIKKGMHLGSVVDPDPDGQPMLNAIGDDNDGMDDEDGVMIPSQWIPGSALTFGVTVAGVPADGQAYLNAWADYDANGDWNGADEHIIIDQPVVNGNNIVSITVPQQAKVGTTYVRFRYSSEKGLSVDGPAPDGEVEDYRISIYEKSVTVVGDLVWHDLNKNGLQEIGEPGLGGVNVHLFKSNNVLQFSTTTNAVGHYAFTNVSAGEYYVKFSIPPGYIVSPKNQGMDALLDSDADPTTGNTDIFAVQTGVIDLSRDCGVFRSDQENRFDFGDAPDPPYPTLFATGGASHLMVSGFSLGGMNDADSDGQPHVDALGDDQNGADDEDGVTFTSAILPNQIATLSVTASQTGLFNGWIDFNRDGDWADNDEHIFINKVIAAGSNALSFAVPATAQLGISYARFRFGKDPGVSYSGIAPEGEVEDYCIYIGESNKQFYKWHQWPLKWNPLDEKGCFQGWDEPSQLGVEVLADDWFCNDPRPVTAIQWWGSYLNWREKTPPPVAPKEFYISIWRDTPNEGSLTFGHPKEIIWELRVERACLHETVVGCDSMPAQQTRPETCFCYELVLPQNQWFHQEGDSTVYWISIAAIYEKMPEKHFWGWKTRRHYFHNDAVRISEPKSLYLGAPYQNGKPIQKGWDMAFVLKTTIHDTPFDYGDAPDPKYPTLLHSNGPHHIYNPAVYLGKCIDTEIDGQPDAKAFGDDASGLFDEDGVRFPNPLSPGSNAKVVVTASVSGYLNAWIDFNGNGSWTDANETIFVDTPVKAGENILNFMVPMVVPVNRAFARFRFSTVKGLSCEGCAFDGEVEDHTVKILSTEVKTPPANAPEEFELQQNHPNPFNLCTQIIFKLPQRQHVHLAVYDLLGQEVRVLVDEYKNAGIYHVLWDGQNRQGKVMASGVYFYRISAGPFQSIKKMLLLK